MKYRAQNTEGTTGRITSKTQLYEIKNRNTLYLFFLLFALLISNRANAQSGADTTGCGKIYVVVDNMPHLIGGLANLQSKLRYPEPARKAGIEGRVYVEFIVTKEGDVTEAKVVRGIGGGANQEALRVVNAAKFQPATQNGDTVCARYSLPIVFKLTTPSEPKQQGNHRKQH